MSWPSRLATGAPRPRRGGHPSTDVVSGLLAVIPKVRFQAPQLQREPMTAFLLLTAFAVLLKLAG
jgi:hypothetical protein